MKKILALAALALLVSAAASVAEDAPKMSAEQQARDDQEDGGRMDVRGPLQDG